MGDVDTASLLFAFPEDIVISSVRANTTEVVLHIASRRRSAACPLCQQPSERVHGQYGRTVADLPCAGRRVILALTVRKFVCCTPTCPRQIFTERLPELVQSYARMTNRLHEALIVLGLATSAQVSERRSTSEADCRQIPYFEEPAGGAQGADGAQAEGVTGSGGGLC